MTSTSTHALTEAQSLCSSQRFNFNDSDITIQSSDGVLFGLHQVNMKINLGFWESIQPKSDAVIQFPEKSATLDLLFQFCYPERHPDLNDLAFDILTELAEAAEKYEVFSAINICKIAMKDALPLNAFGVLVYGATYGYPDVCRKAAPTVVFQKPLNEVLPRLPAVLLLPWVSYHQQWQRIAENAASYYKVWVTVEDYRSQPNNSYYYDRCDDCCIHCGHDGNHVALLLHRLGSGLQFLADIDNLFPTCDHFDSVIDDRRRDKFRSWRSSIEEDIKNIQPFDARSVSSVDSATQRSLITSPNEFSDQPVSARFCALDFDVKFQSSDGVLFQIHKINLEINAGGFVPPEFETNNEIVHLSETAMTLELLFQFCYPNHHPNVEELEFDALALLAEAAEKYQVIPAMNVCKLIMKKQLPEHAADILAYAARHDYPDILDIAAPLVVDGETLSETLPKLPLNAMLRWVKYYETVHPRSNPSRHYKKDIPPFSTF